MLNYSYRFLKILIFIIILVLLDIWCVRILPLVSLTDIQALGIMFIFVITFTVGNVRRRDYLNKILIRLINIYLQNEQKRFAAQMTQTSV